MGPRLYRERTYGAQGQGSLLARGCEMAAHASLHQLLTLLLETEKCRQKDVSSQQQLAASSEVVGSFCLQGAEDPSSLALTDPRSHTLTLDL
ncbi:hypothetical protein PAMP_014750 [Pampus punctatissimus]